MKKLKLLKILLALKGSSWNNCNFIFIESVDMDINLVILPHLFILRLLSDFRFIFVTVMALFSENYSIYIVNLVHIKYEATFKSC